jgi:hypothetical protein
MVGVRSCLAILGLSAQVALAQSAETVRGRVTTDSGRVVRGAAVNVTRGPDRAIKQTLTDSAGRYEVSFDPGTGDYLVAISSPGLRSARRRVQREGTERVLTADFVLSADLAMLAAINVKGAKPERLTTRVSPYELETGASEKWSEGVEAQLSPILSGTVSAIATTMPGVTVGAGGISILGSGPGSNLTTLNGMALGTGSLPRAARVQSRVTGATYDATRGGFSGAATDVRLGPGDRNFQNRSTFFTLEAPQLQVTDAVGRALGAPTQTVRASGAIDGEAIRRVLSYNISADVSRVANDPATLTGDDPLPFALAGVAPDSVRRARAVAQRLALPVAGVDVPATRVRDALSLLGRFDLTADSTWQRHLTTYFTRTVDGAIGYAPLSAPAAGAKRNESTVGGMLTLAHQFGPGLSILNSTRFNASYTRLTTAGYLALPTASVLVRSPDIDGDGLSSLQLGGTPFSVGRDDRWTLEGTNEGARNFRGRRHTLRSALWGRVDGRTQTGGADLLGRYSYNSIDDLDRGRAASFSRTLTLPDRSGIAWNTAAAVTHSWTPSRFFSLLYGVRIEGNGFGSTSAANPALAQLLGVRTDVAPRRIHVSPRVGFSYSFNKSRSNGSGGSNNQTGTYFRYPTGTLRGGIGEFRDLFQPGLIADATSRTGLPGSVLSLTCVGTAIPIPDWTRFLASPDAIPSRCADGSGALGLRAPAVLALDPSYDVPRSWRASLDFNTARWHTLIRLSALASVDLSQPGIVDANFTGIERFRLASEGDRPVYVSPQAIDAATGSVSAAESRRSADFAGVNVRRSDLRGIGAQLTTSVGTDFFDRVWRGWPIMSLAYTVQQSRRQARGFDGEAFDDPRRIEWAPSATDARHILVGQLAVARERIGAVTLFVRAQSGLPFTAVVQGDVNGDGRGGDRAFVPELTTSDPTVRDALATLLASGSSTARACVRSQSGRVAARNGCRTPWTQTLNLQWQLPAPSRWNGRVATNLFINNLLGGLDQLVHGARGLRGWGGQSTVDPVLLVPRGFDPSTRRFRYDINPRFAETRPTRSLVRDPFRITLDMNVRLHTDFKIQSLRRAIEPVKTGAGWARRSEDSLTALYLSRTSSVHRVLIDQSDSLFFNTDQLAKLRAADSLFAERVRAIYRPLARYLATFDGKVVSRAAVDSADVADKAYWKVFWEQPEIADPILTPTQRDLMELLKGLLATSPKSRLNSRWFFGANVPLVHTPAVPPRPDR